MKLIKPHPLNSTTVLSSSIAETDYPAWDVATTYAAGTRVRYVLPSAAVTITIASPAVFTWNNHGLANDTPVTFTTSGTLPTGLIAETVYYVTDRTTNTFKLSRKAGALALSTSGSQSGTHTATGQVRRLYEARAASNVGKYPMISPTKWAEIDTTNTWRMFDASVGSQSSAQSSITVVVDGTGNVDSVALLNIAADNAYITVSDAAAEGAFTITIAAPGVATKTAHGFNNGDKVTLRTTGALPTGLTALTAIYHIVNKAANTFELSLTSGGASITTSGSQSGTHYVAKVVHDVLRNLVYFPGQNKFDISAAKVAARNFLVGAQATLALGFCMKKDGTTVYVTDETTDKIFQYALSVPFDASTGTYSGKSLIIGGQATYPRGIKISPDGTKVYVVTDAPTVSIFQYTLSTAFDISTGSYSGKSLLISGQVTAAGGLEISPDGTKVYASSLSGSFSTYQYTLSTAFDISTGTYSGKSLALPAQPYGIALSPAGTFFYYVDGNLTNTAYQYTLSTAFDISTGVASGKSVNVGDVFDISVSDDGNFFYTLDSLTDGIYQYYIGESFNTADYIEEAIPSYTNPRILIRLTRSSNGDVLCGAVVIGSALEIGGTQYGAKVGIKDYSLKQTDDWGNTTLVERAYAKRGTFLLLMDNAYIDRFQNLLVEYRATPIVWIGTTQYGSTYLLGHYVDFSIEIAYTDHSLCSIEIEGLV